MEGEWLPCLCALVCPKYTVDTADPCAQMSTPGTPWACHVPPGGSSLSLPNSLASTLPSWVLRVGLPGTSWDVTLGPVAIMSLLVSFYTFRDPPCAVLLAFLWGCMQLAMGSWAWVRLFSC